MRIAVAVDDDRGLESQCSVSLEAAAFVVIAEMEEGGLTAVETAANPLLALEDDVDDEMLDALRVDVLVTAAAMGHTCALLGARGVHVATGAQGTARRALIGYITSTLGEDESHAH